MTLNEFERQQQRDILTSMTEQVQYSAERIAHKAMQYKTLVTAPNDCPAAVYTQHLRKFRIVRDMLLLNMKTMSRLSRKFHEAMEKARCKETN